MPRRSQCLLGCVKFDTLHYFPQPKNDSMERFLQWKEIVSTHLEGKTNLDIYTNLRICNQHFENRFFYSRSKRLAKTAHPTLKLDGIQEQETELYDECSSVKEDLAAESIVPEAKQFSWEKQNEAVCISAENVADVPDVMSLDCDDNESISLHCTRPKDETALHQGYHCDICNGEINGFRYTCVQCSDLDLCGACEATAAHNQHYVLRVPQHRPYMEIQYVLAAIRRHLMKKLDPFAELDQDYDDAVSIKSEVKSEPEDEMKESAPAADSSGDSKTTTLCNREDSDDEASIDTNEKGAQRTKLNSTLEVAATISASTPTTSKHHAPNPLNTAKRKLVIHRQDFIKIQDFSTSAKKIRLMSVVPNTKSNENITTVCTPTLKIKPGAKLLLKLPSGAVLKTRQKVLIKSWTGSEDKRNDADNR